jgi:Arc/MetJ-type ribon-helix-helix transcriptional regulator
LPSIVQNKELLKEQLTASMTSGNTTTTMNTAKVAISMEQDLLKEVDRLVKARIFRSRSQAIQIAIKEKISRLSRTRLARECRKLNKKEEQVLADQGLAAELPGWPEY